MPTGIPWLDRLFESEAVQAPARGAQRLSPLVESINAFMARPDVAPALGAVGFGTPTPLKPLLPGGTALFRFPLVEGERQVGEALIHRIGNAINIQNIGSELPRRISVAEWGDMFRQLLKMPEFQGATRLTGTRVSGMGGQKVAGGVIKLGQELDLPLSRFLSP